MSVAYDNSILIFDFDLKHKLKVTIFIKKNNLVINEHISPT